MNLHTTLPKVLRWATLAGIFLITFIPLIVARDFFFPFITGKNFAFRILVELLGGLWLALAVIDPAYHPKRSWLLYAFAAFILVIGIADMHGTNSFKSIWSNYERMEGWVTLAHLLVLFVVASSVLKTEQIWRRFWETSIGVSLVVCGYSAAQFFGYIAIDQGSSRLDATFGNSTYLGVYLLFHLFILALLWSHAWVEGHTKERFRETFRTLGYALFAGAIIMPIAIAATGAPSAASSAGAVFVAYLILAVLGLGAYWWGIQSKKYTAALSTAFAFIAFIEAVILFFTATRGAILGVIGGAFIAAFLLVVLARDSRNAWRAATMVVVGILVVMGGFYLVRNAAWVQNIEPLRRLATISLSDGTTISRFMNASMALKGIKERPLLGWGQEQYNVVFNKYYNPGMYAQEPWFDRVHEIFLDWLIAGGIIGLLAYLSLYATSLWLVWRSGAFTIADKSILTGLLFGYLFYLLFTFDNITSYIMFIMVLAYIALRATEHLRMPALFSGRAGVSHDVMPFAVGVVALLTAGVVYFVNVPAISANTTLIRALSENTGNPLDNLALFKQATAGPTLGTQEAREHFSQAASQIFQANVGDDVKKAYYDTAVEELQAQEKVAPLDARFPLFLGIVYDSYNQHDLAAVELQKALALSPTKQTLLFQYAVNQSVRGDAQGALATYKHAYELDTDYTDARIWYASALIRAGQSQAAKDLLAPVASDPSITADQRLLAAYASRGDYSVLQAGIQAHPTDINSYMALAQAYYQNGDKQRSIDTLLAAEKAIPSYKAQIDPLIEQVRAGAIRTQ